jgi:hypothetical protein
MPKITLCEIYNNLEIYFIDLLFTKKIYRYIILEVKYPYL